jgi:hypothetical protein
MLSLCRLIKHYLLGGAYFMNIFNKNISEVILYMKKRKNILLVSIIIVIIFIIIFLFWYYTPIKVISNYDVCSEDGKSTSVILNLKWHRHLLRPTEVRGSIELNGEVYTNITNIPYQYSYGYGAFDDFIGRLKAKLNNITEIPEFIKEKNTPFPFGDFIRLAIYNIDDDHNITKFILRLNCNDESIAYYGPAKTINDVEALFNINFQ